MKINKNFIQIGIFAAGWTLMFLLVSVALRSMLSSAVTIIGLAAASLFMAGYRMRRGYAAAKNDLDAFGSALKRNKDYGLFAAFTAGLGLAFIFQVVNRYSSGPSGADTVFFLTTAALFAVVLGFINKERAGWGGAIGVAIALAGGIMVLANWERPSSFSPFAIFPTEELLLLVSAFGLALFASTGKRLTERYDPEILLTVALWGVTIVAAVALWPTRVIFTLGTLSLEWWILASAIGILCLATPLLNLLKAVKQVKVLSAVSAVCLMPALITSLIVAEKLSGYASLPTPFIVAPVIAGTTVILIGISLVWCLAPCQAPMEVVDEATSQKPSILSSLLLVLALAQTAWSVIALFFTVKSTAITGTLDSGAAYSAVIRTPGYNTIAGVIMVIAGAAAVLAAYDLYSRKSSPGKTVIWAGVSAVLVASTFFSGKANIVFWSSSIPAEIQHAMGSAYVSVTETDISNIPLLIAYGFAAAFVLVAIAVFARSLSTKD